MEVLKLGKKTPRNSFQVIIFQLVVLQPAVLVVKSRRRRKHLQVVHGKNETVLLQGCFEINYTILIFFIPQFASSWPKCPLL